MGHGYPAAATIQVVDDRHPQEQGLKPAMAVRERHRLSLVDDRHPQEQGLKLDRLQSVGAGVTQSTTVIHKNKD